MTKPLALPIALPSSAILSASLRPHAIMASSSTLLYASLYPTAPPPDTQPITSGPATHPYGPPPPDTLPPQQPYQPTAAELYSRVQPAGASSPGADGLPGGPGANHYPSSNGVPRLPPILQVEKQQVTTSATQLASASRRRNEAHFVCPVPGCGSTFTRRFNLRGHLRSHTEERPYVCDWPNCKKGFARQHDCKRHQALHTAKSQTNVCVGCKKTFSRLDALNRHLRSEGGTECRALRDQLQAQQQAPLPGPSGEEPQPTPEQP